ncbi:MAG: hypothetical protein E7616_07285 [Ruminococcaceae bacterium]|nr:hypothetical protein [Oscillospiraceae bacterium]
MKIKMKHWISYLLVLMLLLSALSSVSVFAKDQTEETFDETEETGPVEWTLSEDGTTLTGNGKAYVLCQLPRGVFLDPSKEYVYANTPKELEGRMIYAPSADSEFIWVYENNNTFYLFATEKGEGELEKFLDYRMVRCRVWDSDSRKMADTSLSFLQKLYDMNTDTMTIDVQKLAPLHCFEILVYDHSDSFGFRTAVIFEMTDGRMYFLDYSKLSNDHFDANGNFSYRSGNVTMKRVSKTLETNLRELAEEAEKRNCERSYEDGYTDVPIAVFWVFYVLFAFIFPIPFLVVGLVMPHSKKKRKPKHWYILAIISAVWLLVGLILMILLL